MEGTVGVPSPALQKANTEVGVRRGLLVEGVGIRRKAAQSTFVSITS